MVFTLSEVELKIQNPQWIRFVGLTIACAFLNIGLYFMTFFITPFIAGVIVGFLLGHKKQSLLSGMIGAFVAYVPLFIYLVLTTSLEGGPVEIFSASVIMSVIGLVGGLTGLLLRGIRLKDRGQ